MQLLQRDVPPRVAYALEASGVHPLLARLFAARGVKDPHDLDDALGQLLPPSELKGMADAARLLADHIAARKTPWPMWCPTARCTATVCRPRSSTWPAN
jgi:single-stranded-DNA-specific exonuclease